MKFRFTFLLAVLLLLVSFGFSSTTSAELAAVGPPSPENGFPLWYQDANGVSVAQCLDIANCAFEPGDLPPGCTEVSFPDCFPEELLYYSAEVVENVTQPGFSAPIGVKFVAAIEGFVDDEAVPPAPATANLLVFRISGAAADIPVGTAFTVNHPFGIHELTADVAGEARLVVEVLGPAPFDAALGGPVGPFLVCQDPPPPPGLLGDPLG